MGEPAPNPDTRILEPGVLERLRELKVVTARFAFHETNDEWRLEDATVAFSNGSSFDDDGDDLDPGLRDALEDATQQQGWYTEGYFALDILDGTITRLDEAFILELCWWQLDEATQAALIRAKVV